MSRECHDGMASGCDVDSLVLAQELARVSEKYRETRVCHVCGRTAPSEVLAFRAFCFFSKLGGINARTGLAPASS